MKKNIEVILEHPIAAIIIITVLFNSITNVIRALKGIEIPPAISIDISVDSVSGDK